MDSKDIKLHLFHLNAKSFHQIATGQKTIESRLYDEKRQLIQPGDRITFIKSGNEEQTITVQVVRLLRYSSFHKLFAHNEPLKFGSKDTKQLEEQINKFYSLKKQHEYGVVGIEFELFDS